MADDWDGEAVRIRWTSSTLLSGTNRTNRAGLTMSVHRGWTGKSAFSRPSGPLLTPFGHIGPQAST